LGGGIDRVDRAMMQGEGKAGNGVEAPAASCWRSEKTQTWGEDERNARGKEKGEEPLSGRRAPARSSEGKR